MLSLINSHNVGPKVTGIGSSPGFQEGEEEMERWIRERKRKRLILASEIGHQHPWS